MQERIVLAAGQQPPPVSSEVQRVFRAMHCCEGKQHYKVLNVHSVQNEMTLLCYVCNDGAQLVDIAKLYGVRPPRPVSKRERKLVRDIEDNGVAGEHRAFVHELKPFVGHARISAASVDLLLYDQAEVTHDQQAMKAGLLVYWDGKQHLRWHSNRDKDQLERDQRISTAAAAEGYNVLRISCKDARKKMQIVDAAWAARTAGGWVKVSDRFNQGVSLHVLHAPWHVKLSGRTLYLGGRPVVPVMALK